MTNSIDSYLKTFNEIKFNIIKIQEYAESPVQLILEDCAQINSLHIAHVNEMILTIEKWDNNMKKFENSPKCLIEIDLARMMYNGRIHLSKMFKLIQEKTSGFGIETIIWPLSDQIFSYVTVQEMMFKGKMFLRNLKVKITDKPMILSDKLDQIQLIKDCHINSKTQKHYCSNKIFKILKYGKRVFWKTICEDILRVMASCSVCRFRRFTNFHNTKIEGREIVNQNFFSNDIEGMNVCSHGNSQHGRENLNVVKKKKKVPRYIKYIQLKKLSNLGHNVNHE